MCKGTAKTSDAQEKLLFSLPELLNGKKIQLDFPAPDVVPYLCV